MRLRSLSHWSMSRSPAWISWRFRHERRSHQNRVAGVLPSARRAHHGVAEGTRYDTGRASRALGVSQQTVFAYELGDRRVSVLILAKLAKVFGMPVENLMGMRKVQLLAKHRLSPAGMRHAERFQQLRRTEQRFVKKIIDVLLEMNAPAPSVTSE